MSQHKIVMLLSLLAVVCTGLPSMGGDKHVMTGDKHEVFLPPDSPLKNVRLHAPFTLVYRVNVSINRSSHAKVLPIRLTSTTTMSSEGKSVLVSTKDEATKATTVWIFDGHRTFSGSSDSTIAQIKPGLTVIGMGDFLMPGLGIPYIPCMNGSIDDYANNPDMKRMLGQYIVNEGHYLRYGSLSSTTLQRNFGTVPIPFVEGPRDGQIMFLEGTSVWKNEAGKPQIEWTTTILGDTPLNVWEFNKHIQFQDNWVASEIHYASYSPAAKSGARPDQTADYELVSASTSPLPQSQYRLTSYLSANTSIDDFSVKPATAYSYSPHGGSLDSQRSQQIFDGNDRKLQAEHGSVPARTQGGVFLACAFIFGGSAWLFWKKRKT